MSAELDPIATLSEQFSRLLSENAELKEGMAEVRAQLDYEDAGWRLIGDWVSGAHLEGLDLEEVHKIAEKLAPRVAAGSLFRRAVDIHSGWTFGRGMFIDGTEKPRKSGRPSDLRKVFTNPANQEALFSTAAKTELQKARFIDGNVLAAVNTKTKEVNRIPFNQITSLRLDPDFPEKILMYKRTWDTQDGTTDSVKSRWYPTTRFQGTRPQSIEAPDGKRIPVEQDVTIVDLRASRQTGHVLGVPDGLPGIHWAEAYTTSVRNGMTVVESLAKILFRVTNKTKAGVQQSAVKMANFSGMGGAASMVEGQELSAVSTAGRGYDFKSSQPIVALAAAAWNVSVTDLLADVSASGSSYGSAQALSPSLRNAMLIMQQEWADFFKDIFEVLGLGRPTIVFEPFEAPDKYRELQAITLGSVALHDQEYRMAVMDALDIVGDSADIPETLKNRGEDATNSNAGVQQGAPDQGKSNGTNSGGQGANDQRTDTLSSQESLRREMALEALVERMESALQRLEAQ